MKRILKFGGPAVAMGLTSTILVGAVVFSHYAQVRDKADMRAGVERDKERLRLRRQKKNAAAEKFDAK